MSLTSMNGLTLTAANSSIFEQKGDKAMKRSLSPDLFRLFEPRAEGRSGDALPVAADEREETLGINLMKQVRSPAMKRFIFRTSESSWNFTISVHFQVET